MKYTVIPIIIIFALFFLNEKNNYPKNKSLILKISNLKQEDIEINLKNEFRRKPHIDYVDGSILTNTIVLNVNEKKFDKSMIEKSGHDFSEKYSSLYADCHKRKFDKRLSPAVLIIKSGSGTLQLSKLREKSFSSISASVIFPWEISELIRFVALTISSLPP